MCYYGLFGVLCINAQFIQFSVILFHLCFVVFARFSFCFSFHPGAVNAQAERRRQQGRAEGPDSSPRRRTAGPGPSARWNPSCYGRFRQSCRTGLLLIFRSNALVMFRSFVVSPLSPSGSYFSSARELRQQMRQRRQTRQRRLLRQR